MAGLHKMKEKETIELKFGIWIKIASEDLYLSRLYLPGRMTS
jgi:hypothetical protein